MNSPYRRFSNRHRIWVPTRKSALLGESASLPRRLRVRNLRVSESLRENEVTCQVADGRRPRTEDGKAFFTTKVTKRTKGLCPRMHADDVIAIAEFLCVLGDLCGESLLCASASLREKIYRVLRALRAEYVSGFRFQVAEDGGQRTEDGKAFFTTKVRRTKGLCPRINADDVIAIAGFLCALGDLCGESLLCASASLREKCFFRDLRVLRGEKIHSLKPAATLVNCYAFNVFKNLRVSATL